MGLEGGGLLDLPFEGALGHHYLAAGNPALSSPSSTRRRQGGKLSDLAKVSERISGRAGAAEPRVNAFVTSLSSCLLRRARCFGEDRTGSLPATRGPLGRSSSRPFADKAGDCVVRCNRPLRMGELQGRPHEAQIQRLAVQRGPGKQDQAQASYKACAQKSRFLCCYCTGRSESAPQRAGRPLK